VGEDERRRDPRLPLHFEAEVRFASWEVMRLLYTVNISRGGMNVELPRRPTPGATLNVKLHPPSGPIIELEAVVRHISPVENDPTQMRCYVGVEFRDLDDVKRSSIEMLLDGTWGR
jgi:hypothetical protein